MFSLTSLDPLDALGGLGLTDEEVKTTAERIISFVRVLRDAEAIAALASVPCADRAKVASLLTAAYPNVSVMIIREANKSAPCATTSSRPKWLMPALIGGGFLAAAGITLAIIRR